MSKETPDTIVENIASEACCCVKCGDCGGSGTLWFDFAGRYLGIHRGDDLDVLETCEGCGGSGIVETCYRCQLLEEMDEEMDR